MLCAGIIFHKIKLKKKSPILFIVIAGIIIASITLFFTKSIGGWLVFTAGTFLFLRLSRRLNKKTILITLLPLILLAAIFIIRSQRKQYSTQPLFSIHKRMSYWKETTKIIARHPLLGVGVGNFSLKESRAAHNSYLQIWAETGIPGIISWLSIVFLFINGGIKNLRWAKNRAINAGIFTAGVAFLLHNIISFSFFVSQAAFLWWIMLALNSRYEITNT